MHGEPAKECEHLLSVGSAESSGAHAMQADLNFSLCDTGLCDTGSSQLEPEVRESLVTGAWCTALINSFKGRAVNEGVFLVKCFLSVALCTGEPHFSKRHRPQRKAVKPAPSPTVY
jgi:hypothetical protein